MPDRTHRDLSGTTDQPQETRMMRIARRAHEIYERRGGSEEKALDDWLQAEREIDAEIDDERARTSQSGS